jgi:20S proteasome alpha/beta subunit
MMENCLDTKKIDVLETDYINLIKQNKEKQLTTIVGIKCKDGVVISSDSQASGEVIKNLGVSKIFKINNNIGLGCAGTASHIKKLVKEIEKRMNGNTKLETKDDFKKELEHIVIELHRTNIVEKAGDMGYPPRNDLFDVGALLGAKINNDFYLFSLDVPNGEVDEVEDFSMMGSGSLFALLVLRQQERIVKATKKSFSELDLGLALWIGVLVINEVKNIEIFTGGDTKVIYINKDGYNQIPEDNIKENYKKVIDWLSKTLGEKLQDNEIEAKIKEFYPKP